MLFLFTFLCNHIKEKLYFFAPIKSEDMGAVIIYYKELWGRKKIIEIKIKDRVY
jgi:hypothetical protein